MVKMKRGAQKRGTKQLSAQQLLLQARVAFDQIPDHRGKDRDICLADSLMSALAMFGLKSPSLLSFNQAYKDEAVRHNLNKLYFVKRASSDTYMREELDIVEPENLRDCFCTIFSAVQRYELLEQYRFLDGYLVLTDETGMFSSDKVHCKNCCEKHHRDGRTTYHHEALCAAIVHPDLHQVLPLCPEPISKQDGTDKNDCERRATQRFLVALKKNTPSFRQP
jgi:hypothetical protein